MALMGKERGVIILSLSTKIALHPCRKRVPYDSVKSIVVDVKWSFA